MRGLRASLVVGLLGVLSASPAWGQDVTDVSGFGLDFRDADQNGVALLNVALKDYGPFRADMDGLKGGWEYELSGVRARIGAAEGERGCSAEARGLAFDSSLKMEIGPRAETESGGGVARGGNESRSRGGSGRRRQAAGRVAKSFADCGVAVEGTLARVTGNCNTVVGSFELTGKGPGANFECGCGGCEVGAAWWWIAGEYGTPDLMICGVGGSVSVSAEGGAGAKVGVKRYRTLGGKLKAGPVGVGAGVDPKFNRADFDDCIDAVLDVGRDLVNGVRNTFSRVVGFFGGGSDVRPSQTGTGNGSEYLRR